MFSVISQAALVTVGVEASISGHHECESLIIISVFIYYSVKGEIWPKSDAV